MKRKDVEDLFDDFSSISLSNPSRKSRRLDADLVLIMDEDPKVNATHDQRGLLQEQSCPSSGMVHANAAPMDTTSNTSEERALVLYDPTKTPFVKSPSSPEFSIIVKADLIPGLKDYLSYWGVAQSKNSVEEEVNKDNSEAPNDCLAVVPWVAFQSTMECEELQASGQPLTGEVGEMMEMDEPCVSTNGRKAMELGGKVDASGAFPAWQQQYCMMPTFLQNTTTPIS